MCLLVCRSLACPPSLLIVLMHSAVSGSIGKSIFLADFRKSTTPSEPIIKLNITWGRQKRKKMKAGNERRHAVITYPFPLQKGDESLQTSRVPYVCWVQLRSSYFNSSFLKKRCSWRMCGVLPDNSIGSHTDPPFPPGGKAVPNSQSCHRPKDLFLNYYLELGNVINYG